MLQQKEKKRIVKKINMGTLYEPSKRLKTIKISVQKYVTFYEP